MAKHVQYDKDEVAERMTHEFTEGMDALFDLETQCRSALDALTGMQFHTESPERAMPLSTAADHLSADLLAQELAGR